MRIIEKIKKVLNGLTTRQTNIISNLEKRDKAQQQTQNELRKIIISLGEKDQERTKTITTLAQDNTKLIQTNNKLTTKIATMRQDMQTQASFMRCVNDAIHTMIAGLAKLPDTMASLDPNFHNNTPVSNVENPPPYKEVTQEILQTAAETTNIEIAVKTKDEQKPFRGFRDNDDSDIY